MSLGKLDSAPQASYGVGILGIEDPQKVFFLDPPPGRRYAPPPGYALGDPSTSMNM
jgi:hypothetical protein